MESRWTGCSGRGTNCGKNRGHSGWGGPEAAQDPEAGLSADIHLNPAGTGLPQHSKHGRAPFVFSKFTGGALGGKGPGLLTSSPSSSSINRREQQEPQNKRVRSDFLQACYFQVRPWTCCVSITHRHPLFIYASKIQ